MLTRGSLKRKGAPALTATSLANDDLYDLSIHHLISRRLWSAIIERVRAHPTIVRKTTPCINGGYFTILHTIMMQGPGMPCQDVVPVIKAILTAADEINILQSESRRNRWRAVHGHYSSTTIIMKVCLHSIFCVKALRFGAMSQ